jgi:hypothetical protein
MVLQELQRRLPRGIDTSGSKFRTINEAEDALRVGQLSFPPLEFSAVVEK